MSIVSESLKQVKQEVFNEMVEGNGRQPAEVVDHVLYMLCGLFPDREAEFREVLDFYPDYTGG